MSSTATLAAEVSAETLSALRAMAAERGVTPERLAGDMLREGMQADAELRGALGEGRRQIASGQGLTHEQVTATLRHWRQTRTRSA